MEDLAFQNPVLNALPNPVIMIDRQGTFEFANGAAEVFFQSSQSILKKRKLDWFLPSRSPIHPLIEQVRESHSPMSVYKIDVSSPRLGESRLVDVYVAPVVENPGSVVIQMQIRSMADTLDKQLTHRGAARTVTGLASVLAHEIKNPLSGIRGAAQLLESSGGEDERVLTKLITDETDRIVRLVDSMEVFSDERPVERSPVNVHAVLDHVKMLALSGFARGVKIIEIYDPSLPPVWGNRDQLVQVFLNLVKNSVEALAGVKDPEITLTTAFRPGMRVASQGSTERVSLPIALGVTDNGTGISEDIRSYLFDPFVSTKQNGSGLGLALVAKIIDNHGGVISCDSPAGDNTGGQGTTFQVLMPMWSKDNSMRISDG